MTVYKDNYRVETTRLPGWDYSSHGYYFITICTKRWQSCFGQIVAGVMVSSDLGRVARDCWAAIPVHFPGAAVDEFVVMPNHVHGIVIIQPNERPTQHGAFGPQSRNLASIIRGYKIGVTKYATGHGLSFQWQPRFYEHVIRSEKSLARIRNYIRMNPERWEFDEYRTASPDDRHPGPDQAFL